MRHVNLTAIVAAVAFVQEATAAASDLNRSLHSTLALGTGADKTSVLRKVHPFPSDRVLCTTMKYGSGDPDLDPLSSGF